MNYYSHNIGDYAQATMHLSLVEDAVYSRLLRRYYAEEAPLIDDMTQLCRWVGARSEEDRDAVEAVVKEFFYLQDGYWHNRRADREIDAYQSKSAKASESASKRWHNNPEKVEMPSECEGGAKAVPTHTEGNANQEPRNNKQTKELKPLSGRPDVSDRKPIDAQAESIINYLNAKAGSRYKPVEANLKFVRARLAESANVEEMRAVIDMKAKEWLGTEQAKYLRPETLFNATKYSQYAGQIGGLAVVAHSREVVL